MNPMELHLIGESASQSRRIRRSAMTVPRTWTTFALTWWATATAAAAKKYDALEQCEVYMAESTIPGAGLGIFTAIERHVNDVIGAGDVMLPLVDVHYHQSAYEDFDTGTFQDPFGDYVWFGLEMNMHRESNVQEETHMTAYAPGLDAAINCNLALVNVDKTGANYDDMSLHRYHHPGAGANTPYFNCSTIVTHPIPAGGELFKFYGDQWFVHRIDIFPTLPLSVDYKHAEVFVRRQLYASLNWDTLAVQLQQDLWELVLRWSWPSRFIHALPKYDEIGTVYQHGMRAIHQPHAIRSPDYLKQHGMCLDHIRHGTSTIPGAGRGAFAHRTLPRGTVVGGAPLSFVASDDYFKMYHGDWITKASIDPTRVVNYQLGYNYCFYHPTASFFLCPYGVHVNYMNHNQTRANIKLQWAPEGYLRHEQRVLDADPAYMAHLEYTPELYLQYVATRDIEAGEELFLDYGDAWEAAWQQHVAGWNKYGEHGADWISPRDWNEQHANDVLRTQDEAPYPDNFELRCNDHDSDAWEWGSPCRIVERVSTGDGTMMYKVLRGTDDEDENEERVAVYDEYGEVSEECPQSRWDEETATCQPPVAWEDRVETVPREDLRFVDAPYTLDTQILGVFRHPILFPHDIFPVAWRQHDPDPSYCRTVRCQPWWREYEAEQEAELQASKLFVNSV